MSENKTHNPYLTMGLKLMIISAAVVLLLSLVNYLTKDIIAKNTAEKINVAISEIFPVGEVSALSVELTETELQYISGVHAVRQEGYITGYCFEVTTSGFGGDVSLIVGINTGSKIEGVRVISHSETPSIGAPVLTGEGLLPAFNNVYTTNISSIDGVSGATYTSNALIQGVQIAADVANKIISENG